MKSRIVLLALLCAVLPVRTIASGSHAGGHDAQEPAIGKPGVRSRVTRTVKVDMTDSMRFNAASLAVKQGQTIRFVVRNSGKLKHEMVLGTEKDLREHAELMMKNPEMEHADANMVTVAPGKTGEIIWQFTKSGKVDFACLQPGHYNAGMKGIVNVAADQTAVARQEAQQKPAGEFTATSADGSTVATAARTGAGTASAEMTEAEVRKIDKDNRKITLKHGAIKDLDMPPMTMVFGVGDGSILDTLKVGAKVRFKASKNGGIFTVTELQPSK